MPQERVLIERIVPLEVWDLYLDGKILWEYTSLPSYPETLVKAVGLLIQGKAESRSQATPLSPCIGVENIAIAGGASRSPAIRSAFTGLSQLTAYFASEPDFICEAGGAALLQSRGLRGPVVDVGQSSIKVSFAGTRTVTKRNFDLLPIVHGEIESCRQQAQALRQFMAEAIRPLLVQQREPPSGIVLALPCDFPSGCVPGGSSYATMKGDPQLVSDVLDLCGASAATALLLNDAELAAYSLMTTKEVPNQAKVLVLTLGFGVGAALIMPVEDGGERR